eukprot:scaffold146_cov265-Pinguiococcus_pyrenoidosus.AAC.10
MEQSWRKRSPVTDGDLWHVQTRNVQKHLAAASEECCQALARLHPTPVQSSPWHVERQGSSFFCLTPCASPAHGARWAEHSDVPSATPRCLRMPTSTRPGSCLPPPATAAPRPTWLAQAPKSLPPPRPPTKAAPSIITKASTFSTAQKANTIVFFYLKNCEVLNRGDGLGNAANGPQFGLPDVVQASGVCEVRIDAQMHSDDRTQALRGANRIPLGMPRLEDARVRHELQRSIKHAALQQLAGALQQEEKRVSVRGNFPARSCFSRAARRSAHLRVATRAHQRLGVVKTPQPEATRIAAACAKDAPPEGAVPSRWGRTAPLSDPLRSRSLQVGSGRATKSPSAEPAPQLLPRLRSRTRARSRSH